MNDVKMELTKGHKRKIMTELLFPRRTAVTVIIQEKGNSKTETNTTIVSQDIPHTFD